MSETEHIYRVKQKIGPFKFFVRKGFKPLQFYSFYSVVKYVVDRKRKDRKLQEMQGQGLYRDGKIYPKREKYN